MRTIERSSSFKRDYKRVKAAPRHSKDADLLLSAILRLLLADRLLPESNRDHALSGNWLGYRECHVKPDLLLIYRKPNADTLGWRGLARTVSYLADHKPGRVVSQFRD